MPEAEEKKPITKQRNKANSKKSDRGWIIKIIFITFALSVAFSVLSSRTLAEMNIAVAFIFLFSFIFIGIMFDILGVAVTAANETPFHSMAAKKVSAALQALKLIRKAEVVANFCNDVIGDICGIISGATGAIIVGFFIKNGFSAHEIVISVLVTAFIASVTVGGKAFGKTYAINHSNEIVYIAAKTISFFKSIFKKRNEE